MTLKTLPLTYKKFPKSGYSKKIAAELLGIKAVFLSPANPFTWASGIKSPIYCDNRLILTAPKARKVVEEAIAKP